MSRIGSLRPAVCGKELGRGRRARTNDMTIIYAVSQRESKRKSFYRVQNSDTFVFVHSYCTA
jgi:hypothetical protein